MSGLEIGFTGFGVLLLLLALRIPIGVAMLGVGIVGYVTIAGESGPVQLPQDRNLLAVHRQKASPSSRCSC